MSRIEIGKGQRLYQEAKKVIPGGTQLLSKRPEMFLPDLWPAYYSKAKGCRIWDLDGEELYSGTPDEEGLYPNAPDARYILHEYRGENQMGMSYSRQGDLLDGDGKGRITWQESEPAK